ncbi:MAG: AAA family ATPase [Candidatus Hydrogenedentota bacterium]|nr:MAG: AAA family ATPase [Candidatus Hydrogenedentota bacterium]
MSPYSEKVIAEVNSQLDIRQLLELIGYRPDKLQESAETIRGFCPIHRETVFRTLIIDKGKRTFRCMYGLCKGASGGTLVDLYALSREIPLEDALKELVEKFGLKVELPIDPEYVEKQLEIGKNFLALEAYEEAGKTFREIVEIAPREERALKGLVQVYTATGNTEELARIHGELACLYAERGERSAAFEHAEKWAELDPGSAQAHALFGQLLAEQGEVDRALEELMSAADLYEAVGDFAAAVDNYKRVDALKLDVVDVVPHILQAYEQMGQPEQAAVFLSERAQAAIHEADFNRAATSLELAIQCAPEDVGLRVRFAEFAILADAGGNWIPKVFETVEWLIANERREEAGTVLRKILDAVPLTDEAAEKLSALFHELGMQEEAIGLRVRAARASMEARNWKRAIQELEELLAVAPENLTALELLAEAYQGAGNQSKALAMYGKLAEVLAARGDFAHAVRVYDQAQAFAKDPTELRVARAATLEKWGESGNLRARQEAATEFEALADATVGTKPARALEFYERAVSHVPPTPELRVKYARALAAVDKIQLATEQARLACEEWLAAGGNEEAEQGVRSVCAVAPEARELHLLLVEVLNQVGRRDQALQELMKLVNVAVERGDAQTTLELLNRALALDAMFIPAIEALAKYYYGQGEQTLYADTLLRLANAYEARQAYGEAIATLERLTALRPDNVAGLERLIQLYERVGNAVKAQASRLELARLHHAQGAYEAEAGVVRSALEKDPENEELLAQLVACEFSRGNAAEACRVARDLAAIQQKRGFLAKAQATLEQALAKSPDDVATNRALFDLLRQMGENSKAVERGQYLVELLQILDRNDEAAEVYSQIVACDPDNAELVLKYVTFLREIGRAEEADERLLALAKQHRAANQLDVAERALLELAERRPNDERVFEELVALYEQQKNFAQFETYAVALARLYQQAGQAKKAVTILRRAAKVLPESVAVLSSLVDAYVSQERPADAVRTLQQIGAIHKQAGRVSEALAAYQRAVEMAPTDPAVRQQYIEQLLAVGEVDAAALQLEALATFLAEDKKYRPALEALNQLIELAPERLSARRLRAEVYEKLGESDKAQEELNQFYLRSLLRQAGTYREQGDWARAAATLREALNYDQKNVELLRQLIECEAQAGNVEDASRATHHLARLLISEKRVAEARELLEQGRARDPRNAELARTLFDLLLRERDLPAAIAVGRELAAILLAQKNTKEAVQVFEQVVALSPKDEALAESYAAFLVQAGLTEKAMSLILEQANRALQAQDYERAERRFEWAVTLDPGAAAPVEGLVRIAEQRGDTRLLVELLQRLAAIHTQSGAVDLAELALRRAIAAKPDDAELRRALIDLLKRTNATDKAVAELHGLAELYSRTGQGEEALAAEEEAVALVPGDALARMRMAETLVALGEVERGVEELETVARLHAKQGRFEEALRVLSECLALMPSRLEPRKIRAEIYEQMGDAARAEQERRQFEVATALQRADTARSRGDYSAEIKALERALKLEGENATLWRRLIAAQYDAGQSERALATTLSFAEQLMAKQDYEAARTLLESGLGKHPGNLDLLSDLMAVALASGDFEEAKRRGRQRIEMHRERGELPQALAIYDELIEADPLDDSLRDEAIALCLEATDIPAALERLFAKAAAHRQVKQAPKVEAALERILEISPRNARALQELVALHEETGATDKLELRLLELAEAHAEQGELETALATARRLVLTNPDNVQGHRLLIRILESLGREADALVERVALVDLLQQLGQLTDAIELARETVALAPMDETAVRALTTVLMASGDREAAWVELEEFAKRLIAAEQKERALAVLDEVINETPLRMSARVQRAELYASLGDQARALEEYRFISANIPQTVAAAGPVQTAAPATPILQIVPEYDFEHFVIGANNNFAYATALAVARAPAQAYNPLFIYSDVGLGKTHLANAIANYILHQNPNVRIIYTNSEDFTAEVVEAIQTNTIAQFRARYKSVDLLIVDDVQFLAGKERAQEEFFHIFNALFQAKKQIVITSDRPPKDIARLENRLLSRFGAGVIVDIAPPDLETRIAILNREIETANLEVPPEVVTLLAERITSNVRELKGALNQIVAMRSLRGMEITPENVEKVLENLYTR